MRLLSGLIGIGIFIWGFYLTTGPIPAYYGIQNMAIGAAICLLSFAQENKDKK